MCSAVAGVDCKCNIRDAAHIKLRTLRSGGKMKGRYASLYCKYFLAVYGYVFSCSHSHILPPQADTHHLAHPLLCTICLLLPPTPPSIPPPILCRVLRTLPTSPSIIGLHRRLHLPHHLRCLLPCPLLHYMLTYLRVAYVRAFVLLVCSSCCS